MRDRATLEVQPQPQVFLGWRIGDEHQPGHSGLEDQSIAAFHQQHDPFAKAANFVDPPASQPSADVLRLNRNWPPLAAQTLDPGNPAADNRGNAPPHRLNFWQLRHGLSPDPDP
jgi:hypothetical protein